MHDQLWGPRAGALPGTITCPWGLLGPSSLKRRPCCQRLSTRGWAASSSCLPLPPELRFRWTQPGLAHQQLPLCLVPRFTDPKPLTGSSVSLLCTPLHRPQLRVSLPLFRPGPHQFPYAPPPWSICFSPWLPPPPSGTGTAPPYSAGLRAGPNGGRTSLHHSRRCPALCSGVPSCHSSGLCSDSTCSQSSPSLQL